MTHTLRGSQRPERNPLELCFCAVLVITCMPIMLRLAPLPGSLDRVPTPFGQLAAALIVIGAAGVVIGILWKNRDTGLLLQQAAMWFLGIGLLFYGVAVWEASGWGPARVAIGLSLGISLGCFARIIQFQIYVRHRADQTDT
jgi:hypothetical protein